MGSHSHKFHIMSLTILLLYPYLLGTSSIGVCLTVIWYITEPPIGIHYSELIFHGILTFVGFIMQTSKLWAQLIFVTIYIYLFFTCSIWAGKLQWLGEKIVIWTKYNFLKPLSHVTCWSWALGNLVVNSVYFLLTENITRGNQGKMR